MIFYFSGTGNSRWAAEVLADRFSDKAVFIPEAMKHDDKYRLEDGEKLGFVFPVYAWGVPGFILDFIGKLDISNVKYLYFVSTCGDDTGQMCRMFVKAVEARGWKCSCGFAVKMPESYVALPGFDVDTPEKEAKKLAEAEDRISYIADYIGRGGEGEFDCLPGPFPWLKTKVLGGFFNKFLMGTKPFHSADCCISCGKCAEVCPMDNIRLNDEKRPEWGDTCVSCYLCYHSCPVHAVRYGGFTDNKGQYLHP